MWSHKWSSQVLETIQDLRRDWTIAQLRDFLNDFLFKKNEDVNKNTAILSGGEKARLCLAKIAAKTPKLLLLDEITNNIDLQTREHIEEVLNAYEGALIVISHDMDFLDNIGVADRYYINDDKGLRSK
ncbi:MAG: ATP-binding cassette domain-containing protein [Elusimicrobiota bacterium]|jgi:ATPase subunit of ABC transporter with duplicated ATPase domains|nr:ATP-binding cassette domain-containing protein [Elusimicrobiota bacterium]